MMSQNLDQLDESLFHIAAEQWHDRTGHRARLGQLLAGRDPKIKTSGGQPWSGTRVLALMVVLGCLSGTSWGAFMLVKKVLIISANGPDANVTMKVHTGESANFTITADNGSRKSVSVDESGIVTSKGMTDISVKEDK